MHLNSRMALIFVCLFLLAACSPAGPQPEGVTTLQATQVQAAQVQAAQLPGGELPATWTPAPLLETPTGTPAGPGFQRGPTDTPAPIPTRTPYTPPPTVTLTPSVTPTPWRISEEEFVAEFGLENALLLSAFPRPAGDNGWGVHWIPTTSQPPDVVDRFVQEVVKMNMKWVVILNDGIHVGKNDYLVDQLVANGIMPVMRLYRSDTSLYDGDAGAVVRHYLPRGVYYYQLYNEPNVNIENRQGFASPHHYARVWAISARQVVESGGYPGLGALSPGGAYNHYEFLDRTLQALKTNGDGDLLGRTWLSVHNYHGTRPLDDPDGFLLFRNYDAIIRAHLWRSMPMIGTEGGSYSADPQVEKALLIYQYNYMRNAEPYLFAFSHWLLANQAGGSFDPTWEWQALFRDGWVHPLVTDFLYGAGQ
jgi:hypothetical protein